MSIGRLAKLIVGGAGVALLAGCVTASGHDPFVSAAGERLEGTSLPGGGAVFRGIPYAAAPVGERRWKAPLKHTPRSGVSDAKHFAPACPQDQGNPKWYRQVARALGSKNATIPDLTSISEDCLYLNIWTPDVSPSQAAPVMVWIHGGSNVNGAAFEPNYLGHKLAEKGIVVVSIQYRLGALGFLAHPALSAEDPQGTSGYYGLLDQLAAVRWIRDNIPAFGGDPHKITLAGESAGGGDIAALLGMDEGKGLFQQAIVQSGALSPSQVQPLADVEAVGSRIIEAAGARSLAQMRALSWQDLLAARRKVEPDYYFAPVADGIHLDAQRVGHGEVPLLIGSNRDEWRMYLPADPQASYRKALAGVAADVRPRVRHLLDTRYGDATTRADRLKSAIDFLCPALALAQDARRSGVPAWQYLFTRVRPGAEALGAYHGAEIPYMFDTADAWLPGDVHDMQLTSVMSAYWANFVKTGNPNASGLPRWPSARANQAVALELGARIKPVDPAQYDICELLEAP